MKRFTCYHLLMSMLITFLLFPELISAQLNSTGMPKATNGEKGFYPATVKQRVTSPENKEKVIMDLSNPYYGSVSNVQAKNEGYPAPGEILQGPKAPFVAGEDIASAIEIISLPYVATGNTCTFINNYDEVCPYSGSTAPDVVYKYYATADISVNIGLCNSAYDTKLFVYDNVYIPGSPMACNDDLCGVNGYRSKIANLNLVAGHWYYIVIDGYGSYCGNYELDIVPTPICTPTCIPGSIMENEAQIPNEGTDVVNGGCNSTPVVFSPISVGQTICGQTNTYLTGPVDNRDTDWYLLDLSSSTDSTQITFDVFADFNLQIIIVKDGPTVCYGYTQLAIKVVPACTHATLTARIGPGKYYLWVGSSQYNGYPPGVATYSYVATLTGGTIPPNNDCANADSINEVGSLPFNTTYATHDGPGLGCGAIYPDQDIWYNYTATFTGEAIASLCGSSFDTRISIFDGAGCVPPGSIIACNDDYCGLQSQLTFNVISGHTYKILVGGFTQYSFGQGYLTIKPNCLTECPYDASPENEPVILNEGTDVTNGGCNYQPYTYSPITLGQTYCGMINTFLYFGNNYRDLDWYRLDLSTATDSTLLTWDLYTAFKGYAVILKVPVEDCYSSIFLADKILTPCIYTPLTARVSPGIYYLVITSYNFAGLPPEAGPYRYTAKLTGQPIPQNDRCQNAAIVGEVTNLPFNTTAALHDGTGTCLASSASRNIWYAYYPVCTGTATISLCGSFYDTKLAVYNGIGCSPYGSLLGCNDDYCGLASSLTVPVIFGHAYMIEIGGYNPGAYGQGLLTIHCTQTLPVNLNLQDITINQGQSTCYNASGIITVGGAGTPFTILSGARVTMVAGQKIQCLPGTTVKYGGYLHGYIYPAGPWCSPPIDSPISGKGTGDTKETLGEPTAPTSFFKVYPNPTSGSFTLEFTGTDEPGEVNVEIYGMHGDKVLSKHLAGQRKHLLNIGSESTGIYILRVVKANETGSVKIVRN
jgi:hypothetical protein